MRFPTKHLGTANASPTPTRELLKGSSGCANQPGSLLKPADPLRNCFSCRVVAHELGPFADGQLLKMSNCRCLPGKAGRIPLVG